MGIVRNVSINQRFALLEKVVQSLASNVALLHRYNAEMERFLKHLEKAQPEVFAAYNKEREELAQKAKEEAAAPKSPPKIELVQP